MNQTTAISERDPLTDRGRRTRESLVLAARKVFEQRGYSDARMSDIADGAGVAHGTVYTYFEDKDAIFRAVLDAFVAEIGDAWRVGVEDADPITRIAEANRRFLAGFISHARMFEVIDQASTSTPSYRDKILDVRQGYVERAVAGIRRLQREGLVDKKLDAYLAGSALCAMVEGFGRQWIVRNESHQLATVTKTLTRLWAQALGLQPPRAASKSPQPA